MHIGFSGTQTGMSQEQIWTVSGFLDDNLHFSHAHHGDCIGSDADFHRLCRLTGLKVIGHPPINNSKRAFCEFDEERAPEEYLDRNRRIVRESGLMLFTPAHFVEELRSGTWSTVRYTRELEVPGLIFWPDGSMDDA